MREPQFFSGWPTFCRVSVALLAALFLSTYGVKAGQDSEEKPKSSTKSNEPSRVAVAHILISHDGAMNPPSVSRSKEEARRRAEEALAKVRTPGTEWGEVVKEFTDDGGSSGSGGKIGIIEREKLPIHLLSFGEVLFAMEIGQISGLVESPLGVHILKRLEIIEYAATHILIQYEGSKGAPPTITRTKEEAKKLTEELWRKAQAQDANFAVLAKENSDDTPSARRGGSLGIFAAGQLAPALEEALETMKPGDIKGPVASEYGFHVIRRDKIERVGASHILISYQGADRSQATRTKEEALDLAKEVLGAVRKDGADFAALAMKHSDGPSGPKGGRLGVFGKGGMVPEFEKSVFALEIGEVAGPVETPFGYHIILRTE